MQGKGKSKKARQRGRQGGQQRGGRAGQGRAGHGGQVGPVLGPVLVLHYRTRRGCSGPHGAGEAGERTGSLCAIEELKRRQGLGLPDATIIETVGKGLRFVLHRRASFQTLYRSCETLETKV